MRRTVQNFTPSTIDNLRSGKRADPVVPGLWISISTSGRKVWTYRRRVSKSDAIVSLKLGPFPAFNIPAARAWAGELNLAVERGEDPRTNVRLEKSRQAMTVDKAHGIYMQIIRLGERKKLKPRTISDKLAIFSRDISPRLGNKPLADLTEDECWDAVYDKARASKDRANKMAGELCCFLKWCAGREGRVAGIELAKNPASTLNQIGSRPAPRPTIGFSVMKKLAGCFRLWRRRASLTAVALRCCF